MEAEGALDVSEETREEVLQREKEYLVRDITEEIEHLTKQLAAVDGNIRGILQQQVELNSFAEQWAKFQTQCKKTEGSS